MGHKLYTLKFTLGRQYYSDSAMNILDFVCLLMCFSLQYHPRIRTQISSYHHTEHRGSSIRYVSGGPHGRTDGRRAFSSKRWLHGGSGAGSQRWREMKPDIRDIITGNKPPGTSEGRSKAGGRGVLSPGLGERAWPGVNGEYLRAIKRDAAGRR